MRVEIEREAVREKIENAFRELSYPGDDNLVPRSQYDDDEQDAEALLKGKHWTELELIRDGKPKPGASPTLFFVTPAAFQFYLPSFLLAALDPDQAGVIVGTTVERLTPSRWSAAQVALLNAEQRNAVAAFLTFLSSHYPGLHRRNVSEATEYFKSAKPD